MIDLRQVRSSIFCLMTCEIVARTRAKKIDRLDRRAYESVGDVALVIQLPDSGLALRLTRPVWRPHRVLA
jgi:hypothetical protein